MTVGATDDLAAYLARNRARVNEALDGLLPREDGDFPELARAMRYSVFAGGKRIRPILCMAAAEAAGGPEDGEQVLPVACALECIHTYSLIHDDLPAMDDDDYRRGRLTSHKVFGEALAILAGDALLTIAFQWMADPALLPGLPQERLLAAIREIASGAGYRGMVGGQVADMEAEGRAVDMETLQVIHAHKTGALLTASVRAGALLAAADPETLAALTTYGTHIGLAFQVADDILNVEGDRATLGKRTGSDAVRGKATFPGLAGLPASRDKLRALVVQARDALASLDDRAEPLRALASYLGERTS